VARPIGVAALAFFFCSACLSGVSGRSARAALADQSARARWLGHTWRRWCDSDGDGFVGVSGSGSWSVARPPMGCVAGDDDRRDQCSGWPSQRHDRSRLEDAHWCPICCRHLVLPSRKLLPVLTTARSSSCISFPNEALRETINATVHGFICTVMTSRGTGYRLYWVVYVMRVSWLTRPYLIAIEPFRRILYPAMLRRIRRAWVATYVRNRRSSV